MKYLKTYKEKKGMTFQEWLKNKPQDINTTKIWCDGQNLTDLDGIKDFKNLQELYCSNNQLKELNLEGMENLQYLYCEKNWLKKLDLEGLKNLYKLWCSSNQLKKLEGLENLRALACSNNHLKELDGLENLQVLYCDDNHLPYVDLDSYWSWWEKEYPDKAEAKKFNF